MPTPPSFGHLRSVLTTTFGNVPDNRTSRNRLHTLSDAALGAFSVFFTQTPSFLAYQRQKAEATYELSDPYSGERLTLSGASLLKDGLPVTVEQNTAKL